MAVGIVIGAAFGKIVTSLVNDIIMPPIGLLLGQVNFSSLAVHLNDKTAINYGVFINSVLDFLIVAFCIFLVVKQINRFKAAPPPAAHDQGLPQVLHRHSHSGHACPALHVRTGRSITALHAARIHRGGHADAVAACGGRRERMVENGRQ